MNNNVNKKLFSIDDAQSSGEICEPPTNNTETLKITYSLKISNYQLSRKINKYPNSIFTFYE